MRSRGSVEVALDLCQDTRAMSWCLARYRIPLRWRLGREHEGYNVGQVELISPDVVTRSNEVLIEYCMSLIGFVRARTLIVQRAIHRRYERYRTYVLCLWALSETRVDNTIMFCVSISRKRHVLCLNSLSEIHKGYLKGMSSRSNLDTLEDRIDMTWVLLMCLLAEASVILCLHKKGCWSSFLIRFLLGKASK